MKVITLKEFKQLLKPIKEFHEQMDIIDTSLEKIFPETKPYTELGLNVESAYIQLIGKYLENEFCEDRISYFIYDCNFGKNPLTVKYTSLTGKKVSFKMKNIEALYNYIYGV